MGIFLTWQKRTPGDRKRCSRMIGSCKTSFMFSKQWHHSILPEIGLPSKTWAWMNSPWFTIPSRSPIVFMYCPFNLWLSEFARSMHISSEFQSENGGTTGWARGSCPFFFSDETAIGGVAVGPAGPDPRPAPCPLGRRGLHLPRQSSRFFLLIYGFYRI